MRTTTLAALGLLAGAAAYAQSIRYRADQQPGTPEQVERGKALFAMCVPCHGAQGEGKVGVAPRLNSPNYLAIIPNDFIRETLKRGRSGTNMAAFGAGMPEADLDALVAYIRSWQTVDGMELDESPLRGDVATGEALYRDICSRCHGRSGAGYSEAGSGTGIGRRDFLEVASNGMLRAVIRHGKDQTPMRSFSNDSPVSVADLTDEQIDSIIQYLRANAW